MFETTTLPDPLVGLTPNQQRGLVRALLKYAQCLNPEESRNAVTPSFNHGGKVCVFCGPRGGWFYDGHVFNQHAEKCPCEPPDINKLLERISKHYDDNYELVRSEARRLFEVLEGQGTW